MKTFFEGKPFYGKWRRSPDSYEGKMSTKELEQKLNQIDSEIVFEVEEHIDGISKDRAYLLEKLVYIVIPRQKTHKLLFSIVPPDLNGDYPFWYVDTTGSDVRSYDSEEINLYLKALQLAKAFMPSLGWRQK